MPKSINFIGNYTYFKNCEHVGDDCTCEFHGRTTDQQYSIATSLVSCMIAIKCAIALKGFNRVFDCRVRCALVLFSLRFRGLAEYLVLYFC